MLLELTERGPRGRRQLSPHHGDLVQLLNGSTLTLSNGALLAVTGNSVVNISGALLAYGSGSNTLNVTNSLCSPSCSMIGGIPVALTGGAVASNVTIGPNAIKNLGGGGSLSLPSLSASAHPADMYAQRLSVALTPEALHLDWQILPGPFLADAVWAAADQDQNGVVSDPEAETWIAPFVSDLSISLDGQPLTHAGMQEVHWPSSVEVMRTAEDRIRFSLRCDWPLAPSGRHTVEIHSSYLEANSLNWFSVSAAEGISFAEPAQDNGLLHTVVHLDGSAPPGGMASWNSGHQDKPDSDRRLFSCSLLVSRLRLWTK